MRTAIMLVIATTLLVCAQPLLGKGLLASTVVSEPLRLSSSDEEEPGLPDHADLDDPAMMQPSSSCILVEYEAENLLHTRKNGKTTADIVTSGNTESLFIPARNRGNRTVFAVSRESTGADLFYDDPKLGSQLSWGSDSFQWAVRQRVGTVRVGLMSFDYSGLYEGFSAYPRTIFRVLGASTDTRIGLKESGSVLQLAIPLGNDGRVILTTGSSDFGVHIGLGQGSSLISIPIEVSIAQHGIDLQERLSRRVFGRISYSWSSGDGDDHLTLNGQRAGRLQSRPRYSRIAVSIRYRKNPRTVREVGYVSAKRNLWLRGLNINGDRLDLDVGTFNDMVDFAANMDFRTSFYHLGLRRRVSKKWEIGTRYKLIRVSAAAEGDYVGRALFGLISFTGTYEWSKSKSMIHALELSATYHRGALSTTIRVEQLVPQPAHSRSGPRPSETKKTTGGTSFTLSCGYAF